jgi:hypothetical protein
LRSFPAFFLLFCVLVVGGLGVADARGWLLRSIFVASQNAHTFASHYHK